MDQASSDFMLLAIAIFVALVGVYSHVEDRRGWAEQEQQGFEVTNRKY